MNVFEVFEAAHGHIRGRTPVTGFDSFGADAIYILWGPANEDSAAACVCDPKSGEVFSIEIYDAIELQAWRWDCPSIREKFFKECERLNIDVDIASNNVRFAHVDSAEALLILNRLMDSNDTT